VKGFTGDQAVIIPASNVQHLMLREDIVEAVKDGRFNIWAVNTIDEGISLLTGIEAGERDEKGKFPAGSINALVEARLSTLAQALSLNDDSEPRKRLVRHRR
jgi:predicted ATP-dependent protease